MLTRKALALGTTALVLSISSTALYATSTVVAGFNGQNLTGTAALNSGTYYIPPDTMGAVGTTQFVETLNGSFNVYSKAGVQQQAISGNAFWQAAGATSFGGNYTGGDPRVLFNASQNRWIAVAFGGDANGSYLNIGVSNTADATGTWKASTFLGFNGAGGNGTADFPTLAMDNNAVYIASTNFDPGFVGTTLNVIPLSDVFGAVAPNVGNRAIFTSNSSTLGFAIQGVNSNDASTTGQIIAARGTSTNVGYDITNAGGGNGVAAEGALHTFSPGTIATFGNLDGRQPDGTRTVDTGDLRIGSSVWEQNGKIYFVQAVNPVGTATVVRITVLDSATYTVLQSTDIGDPNYDFYMPSLAVSASGVVVGYNRSGYDAATGNIAFYANAYTLDANGLLVFDATHLLKQSTNNGYCIDFEAVCGPGGLNANRWGDYSAVTVDPTDSSKFWLVGEYATTSNVSLLNNDGWATWIGAVQFSQAVNGTVPEPATWAQMLLGFGMMGAALRGRRRVRVRLATQG